MTSEIEYKLTAKGRLQNAYDRGLADSNAGKPERIANHRYGQARRIAYRAGYYGYPWHPDGQGGEIIS